MSRFMTYCLSIQVNEGLVFASDSRTNAGVDNINTYPKTHTFDVPGERVFVVLSAGNLATTQAVIKSLRQDMEAGSDRTSLANVESMEDAASYVGVVSREVQEKNSSNGSGHEAEFILGGQIEGAKPEMYLIYAEGNHIEPSPDSPFFQIGEIKYGKPILDRIITSDTSIEDATRCALVSLDSTMKSNLTVGPPLDLLIYRCEQLQLDPESRLHLDQDAPLLVELRTQWAEGLRKTFNMLPRFEWEQPAPKA